MRAAGFIFFGGLAILAAIVAAGAGVAYQITGYNLFDYVWPGNPYGLRIGVASPFDLAGYGMTMAAFVPAWLLYLAAMAFVPQQGAGSQS